MPRRFLSERLVTTPSFSPAQTVQTAEPPPSSPAAPPPDTPAPAGIEGLVRAEEKQVREAAVAGELAEAERRRVELLEHLQSAAAALERERADLDRQRALFLERSRTLAGAGHTSTATPSLALLRELRRELQ